AAAELRGQLHPFDDEDALAALLVDMSEHFEASVGQHWRFEPQRTDHRSQLRGIIGFRFVVDQVQLKLKLSQNHPAANQQAVIDALDALATPRTQELAQWMQLHRTSRDAPQ